MTANVLVVDDLETNVKLLKAKLEQEYYTVFTANSGRDALEQLKKNKIDVVLLDVMMPEMDGFQVCKRIKEDAETTNIPVIMVTALSDIENRVAGLEAGADEFLTKPINDIALFIRLKSLSRIKSLTDELKLRNKTNVTIGRSVIKMDSTFDDKSILLINDDVVQAKNIKSILLKISSNITVITESSKINEMEYIPDVVIISGSLENEDPLRISATLRGKTETNGTILILSVDEENLPLVTKGIELGVNDYFIYPIEESELLARIRTQLRKKQYQDNLRNDLETSINLSIKDGLTSLFNRHYFDIHIKQMVEEANKNSDSITKIYLLMCDVDNFKHVNDTYGHQAGDVVLKTTAQILKNTFRVTDLIARFGGEEFIVIFHGDDIKQAVSMAERVRTEIECTNFNIEGQKEPIKKTISIGVTEYKNGEPIEEFIQRADQAMYMAKTSGKNKTVTLTP